MKYQFTWFAMVLALGLGFMGGYEYHDRYEERNPERYAQDYDAYRECIPKPGCMTATDYIDYYDLKWKLEKELTDMK